MVSPLNNIHLYLTVGQFACFFSIIEGCTPPWGRSQECPSATVMLVEIFLSVCNPAVWVATTIGLLSGLGSHPAQVSGNMAYTTAQHLWAENYHGRHVTIITACPASCPPCLRRPQSSQVNNTGHCPILFREQQCHRIMGFPGQPVATWAQAIHCLTNTQVFPKVLLSAGPTKVGNGPWGSFFSFFFFWVCPTQHNTPPE